MKIKLPLAILTLIFISMNTYSQDLHFSQFNENPSLINPALTGANSVFRASAIYRDQWRSVTVPYKTYGVSVETKFKASSWKKVEGQSMTFSKAKLNRFAGGLSFYTDKAGDGNAGFTQVNLSLATFVPTGANSNLSVGLQASIVQRKIDFTKLVFSNQYNGTGYDNTLQNGENVATQSFIYPDFAGGLNWNYSSDDKSIASNNEKKANIGISFYHVNQPKQVYLAGGGAKLHLKYVLHGDFLFGIKHTNIAIAPTYLFQFQGANMELVAGTQVKYYIKEDSKYTGIIQRSSVNLGVYYRYQDAMVFSFMYDRKQQFAIGISYDFNVSSLTKASKLLGGPELLLRFNTANAYLYQKKAKAMMD